MTTSTRSALDQKIKGWDWVVAEFTRLREARRVEAERRLGPDRGE